MAKNYGRIKPLKPRDSHTFIVCFIVHIQISKLTKGWLILQLKYHCWVIRKEKLLSLKGNNRIPKKGLV